VQVASSAPEAAAAVLGRLGLAQARAADGASTAVLGGARPEDVVAALVHAGVPVRGFTVERPRLEDVFVGLTGEGFDVSG
jgi:hypothetical protein